VVLGIAVITVPAGRPPPETVWPIPNPSVVLPAGNVTVVEPPAATVVDNDFAGLNGTDAITVPFLTISPPLNVEAALFMIIVPEPVLSLSVTPPSIPARAVG